MLSEKICKKCYAYQERLWQSWRKDRSVVPFYWKWICYEAAIAKGAEDFYVCEGDEPPKWCPYALEHILEMQEC